MWPVKLPKRCFSDRFGLDIPARSTLGALLVPLFRQFQKRNSRKFALTEFYEVRVYRFLKGFALISSENGVLM